jgi:uncharacterized protein YkwD
MIVRAVRSQPRPNDLRDLHDLLRREPRRLAAMVLVAFAATSIGLLALPRTTLAWDANAFNSSSERQLVTLTNQSRAAAGLRALKIDSTLTSIARQRSKDMIVRDYFSHEIPPQGYNVFHILDTKGYCYKLAGENIGWNTYPDDVATAAIHSAFMKSAGHRANILGKSWDVIGVGAYKGPDGKKMWTVLFADRCGSTATPKPTPKPTAKPRPTAKPTPRPTAKPRATPKPTPKATPKATAKAEPSPSPSPSPSPTPSLEATPSIPSDPSDDPGATTPSSAPPSAGPPPQEGIARVRAADPATTEASLRVVDPPTSPGLLEAVVSGVTGFYLGS